MKSFSMFATNLGQNRMAITLTADEVTVDDIEKFEPIAEPEVQRIDENGDAGSDPTTAPLGTTPTDEQIANAIDEANKSSDQGNDNDVNESVVKETTEPLPYETAMRLKRSLVDLVSLNQVLKKHEFSDALHEYSNGDYSLSKAMGYGEVRLTKEMFQKGFTHLYNKTIRNFKMTR